MKFFLYSYNELVENHVFIHNKIKIKIFTRNIRGEGRIIRDSIYMVKISIYTAKEEKERISFKYCIMRRLDINAPLNINRMRY